MKFWGRIVIYSMVLFLLIFNGAGVFIIENIHKRSLDRTVRASVSEHGMVERVVYLNMDINDFHSIENEQLYYLDKGLSDSGITDKQLQSWLGIAINSFSGKERPDGVSYEFYNGNGDLIFSDTRALFAKNAGILKDARKDERFFIIRNTSGGRKLLTMSSLKVFEHDIVFVLVKDIDYIYHERVENYKTFLMLDVFVAVLLAAGMFVIAKGITKPLIKFSNVSREIAEGDYSKRVTVRRRRDEIGILAENYNIMAQAVEDKILELKEANAAKQRFIDSLTHEMKTPLTSIIGYSDLLVKGNVNDAAVRFKALNYINSEAKRLENMCFALLKLILIKREELAMEEISLKDCIANVMCSMSYKLEEKGIAVRSEVEDASVMGVRQLIVILLVNLLDNAVKASEVGGSIELKMTRYESNNNPVILIRDFGVGIPEEDLDKIREPFFMVDKARDRAKSGVGLGLAISDEICRVHNINMDFWSRVGKGTLVTIEFCGEGMVS